MNKRGIEKRILILSVVLLIVVLGFFIKAENPVTAVWSVIMDGPLNQYEEPSGIALDNNSNVYITGYSPWNSISHIDLYLGKWNSSGTNLWNATMGYPLADHILGKGIAIDNRTSDIYVVGYAQMNNPSTARDIYLGRFNSTNGNNIWNHTLNGPKNVEDYGYGVAVDNNSNIYITGWTHWNNETNYDIYIGKFNSSGNNLWNATIDMISSVSGKHELGNAIAVDSIGNIYVTGATWVNSTRTALYLGKFNSTGSNLWNLTVPNPQNSGYTMQGTGIAIDRNSNIYISGDAPWSSGTSSDIYLGKFNSSGNNLWNFTLNGPKNSNDFGYGVAVDDNSNIYLSGYSLWSYQTYFDVYLGKFNSSGTNLWNTTIASGALGYYGGKVVVQPSSGDIYITATANYNADPSNADIYVGKFSIDTINPTADFSCTPSSVMLEETVTCSCVPSDVFSGINSSLTSYTTHPDTSQTGDFTETCSFADIVGNTGSVSVTYNVNQASLPQTPTPPRSETETFPTASPGSPADVIINNSNMGLTGITINVSQTVSNISITVTKLNSTQGADLRISLGRNGALYEAYEITTSLSNQNISNVEINFKVNKSWLANQNRTVTSVRLYRYVNNAWTRITTTLMGQDNGFYYFNAVSPGFSTFVVFFGEFECDPGERRCFENQAQLCLGNATWLVTEKCFGNCEEGECSSTPLQSNFFYIGILLIVLGLVAIILFKRKSSKKKRKK